jgi:hypothetical protein
MKHLVTMLIAGALCAAPLAAAEPPPELTQMCSTFFNQLRDNKVNEAYAQLLQGSKIAAKLEDIAKLQDRTSEMIQNYGPVLGYDLVNTDFVGRNLCRMTYLTRSDTSPVRWRIVFYRPSDHWRVFNLQIDDAVMEFFSK